MNRECRSQFKHYSGITGTVVNTSLSTVCAVLEVLSHIDQHFSTAQTQSA